MKTFSLEQIYRAFSHLKTPREAALFLEDILTPDERISVGERLQIFKMLAAGIPHREISKKLKVSIAKVTRGSHALRSSKGGYSLIAGRI